MWVQGTFTWDSEKDTATVTNVSSGYDKLIEPFNVKISDEVTKSDSNQGNEGLFGIGHKYAYIEYSLTTKTDTWKERQYSIYLDVNTEGTKKTK